MAPGLVRDAIGRCNLAFHKSGFLYNIGFKYRRYFQFGIVGIVAILANERGGLLNNKFYMDGKHNNINLNKSELYNKDPSSIAYIILSQIPNTEILYYSVIGNTPDAIRRSMDEQRPRNPDDWSRFDALTTWHIDWRWPSNGRGGCDLSRLALSFRATVIMPNLVNFDTVDPKLQRRWKKYILALASHELWHVKHAYERRAEVYGALRNSTCETVNDVGAVALRHLKDFDIQYDEVTGHGATQGAVWP